MMISVIIATKDRAALLDAALASLRAQENAPAVELVVVDNGSTDATPQVAARHGAVYAYVAEPHRGKARNAGIDCASGDVVLFVDDDVVTPPHFLAAHAQAHAAATAPLAVSGPIINVPDPANRPEPTAANFSRAFFVTCNVSVRATALRAVGGFDEAFDLYGWEDTELGARLRESGVQRAFAWDAYLWHIKPPTPESLEDALGKALEKAKMAARFVRKMPTARIKLATGAYTANLVRARVLAPPFAQSFFAGLATSERVPRAVAALARAALLDSVYTEELDRQLRER
ncbi:MAG: glycosyltransferase [Candidatus Eremiobacteraeota bacterium]|nr:glycosyltransferase [Candidatus Eremiobacteraeota bacterium]MBV9409598.1 glycosyltransferase [Candidatus Eremiobacteraeota bacterium]